MEELSGLIPVILIFVISAVVKSAQNKQKQAQTHPYQKPASAARPPQTQSMSKLAAPQTTAQPRTQAHTVAQPTVHTHLAPDCEIHDAPTSGSLNVKSTEGKDPCHEDQLTQRRDPLPEAAAEQPGLTLDFNGDALVKAFVMQEVLTRPSQRRAR